MRDYHAEQFDPPSQCASKDCAAASGAMAVFFGTRGAVEMTHVTFRNAAAVSCVPGVHSPSGGLYIGDVVRVAGLAGVDIDYSDSPASESTIRTRLGTTFGAVLQGMYSNVETPWRAKGSTFRGGHSVWAHDYRTDLPDSHYGKVQPTYCWHDPLRARPIRVPASVVTKYTQTASPVKGNVGFTRIPALERYTKPMPDRTRTKYATTAVHRDRTKGEASTIRVIRGKGQLVTLYMYAEGESWRGETTWGALDLLGNQWVNLGRLTHVGGTT